MKSIGKITIPILYLIFSMAKSVTSILCGIAIKEGYIESVEDKVSKYLPSYLERNDQILV